MWRSRVRLLRPESRSQSGQRSKLCLSNNSKTFKAKLTKLHRKIENNEEVSRVQDLVPTPKVKVAIRSKVKILSQH